VLLPHLQAAGGDQAKKDDFLRWVQVCNHPWALAISTPCKFESQQDVKAVRTSRLERRKLGGEGGSVKDGFSALCLSLRACPTPGALGFPALTVHFHMLSSDLVTTTAQTLRAP
jgi:hypothetical protein